jgi:hypothetical protein
MTEVKISGQTYRINRLDAMKQFHIARKVLPVVAGLAQVAIALFKEEKRVDLNKEDIISSIGPITEALSSMPDKDFEDVVMRCMASVQRQSGSGWADMTAKDGRSLMFQDIQGPELFRLTAEVIKENLGGFLALVQPQDSTPAPAVQ